MRSQSQGKKKGYAYIPNEAMDLISEGRLFQSKGALNIKALLPTDFLARGTEK